MVNITDTREIILALKKVYADKELSIDKTLVLVNSKVGEGVVSRSTIQALFAEGSEDGTRKFGYDTVLKPLCIALLDIENIEQDDPDDVKAYKAILKFKKNSIDGLKDEIKNDKLKYHEQLEEQVRSFSEKLESMSRQLAFMSNQINLKDARIDELLSVNKENSTTIKEIVATNNKLVHQLMDCPLRHKDTDEG